MDEILKIIIRRNKERVLLTENDIKRICNIMIKGKNYQEYVKEIIFEKEDKDDKEAAGQYDGTNLYFFNEGLNRFAEMNFETLGKPIDGTRIDYYNFFTLVTIFHELAHVRQAVKEDFKLDKDGQLFDICETLHHVDNFYMDNYKIDIREVNAFALGFMNACSFYVNLPRNMITEYDMSMYKHYAISKMLSSYTIDASREKIISPAEKLFESADKYNLANLHINKDKFYSLTHPDKDYTIYRKLCMGFPMSFDSYAYLNLLLTCNNAGSNFSFIKKMQSHH